jgi:multidrug transporter EmrE-like cation transporter
MMAKIPQLAWIVVSVLCSSMAHLLLKLGANRFDLQGSPLQVAIRAAANAWLVGGISLHVLALGFWIIGLKQVQLSIAYPFIAVGFVLVALLSWFFLGENFGFWRIIGMLLIVSGVSVVARS